MSEESTTPDLVELTRYMFEAANRQDRSVDYFSHQEALQAVGLGE